MDDNRQDKQQYGGKQDIIEILVDQAEIAVTG